VAKKAVDRLAVYLLAAEKAAQTCPPPLAFQGPGEPRFSDLLLHVSWSAIAHLVGLMGSSVKATLEIEADVSGGRPERRSDRNRKQSDH